MSCLGLKIQQQVQPSYAHDSGFLNNGNQKHSFFLAFSLLYIQRLKQKQKIGGGGDTPEQRKEEDNTK